MEVVSAGVAMEVHVEAVTADAEVTLPDRADASVTWHVTEQGTVPGGRLVEVARSWDSVSSTTHVWAAGEASAVQAIRQHLFTTLGLDRSTATVRGYWKPAR